MLAHFVGGRTRSQPVKTKARLPEYSGRRCPCGDVAATCTAVTKRGTAHPKLMRGMIFQEQSADVETSH